MVNIVVLLKFYKGEISLFDSAALECALETENAEVTIVAMAPLSAKEPLRQLSRLGVDRAILISDPIYAGSDTLATSKVLSKAIKKLSPDVVLCGRQSMDGDTAQVPPAVATITGYNLITNALEYNLNKVNTRLGEKTVKLPVVMSMEKIRNLRFPSLRSKPKDVEIWDNSVLGIDNKDCGLNGSPTKVLSVYEKQTGQRECKFIAIDQLDEAIKSALKKQTVKTEPPRSAEKLEKIFIVGDGLTDLAENLANSFERVKISDPKTIADQLIKENAKHVLFIATIENRAIAPCVAALLNTGLAADCIVVETDGKNMFCYRPAASESVVAKIGFKNGIEMATVRSPYSNDNEIIFSIGYGAKDHIDKITKMASKYGATVTASRKVVDSGLMDYSTQVGLTGKIVRPKVYVAFGISGAVQHTVGIENANTVIAVNCDKNAKIFDCADYGVIEDISKL